MAQSIDPTLTMDELRVKLQSHLKKSGALTSLKTQLRAMVLTEVTGQKMNEANQQVVPHGGNNNNCGGGGVGGRNAYAARLADELVEAHLRGTFRSFSHSIFSSEANLQDLNSNSGGGGAYGRDADLALALDIPFNHHDPQQYTSSHSLLTALMERCLKRRSQRSLVSNNNGGTVTAGAVSLYDFQDSSCQTSESELLRNGPFPSYHTLEQKLSLVDAEHALRRSHVEYATTASLESRMKQHKEELEIVMQKELERKYQQFRAKELAAVRAEEYEKYQHMLRFKEEEKREFERSVEYRMQLERERMEQLKIDLSMQREAMEKRGHDVLALSREREQSATFLERALEEKKGAMQKLQAQLSRLEDICAQRFDEVETYKAREGRRLAEMQRQQRDHLAELKMRDDEIAECRYRLKVVTEEYKHNIERLTVDYARGGPRISGEEVAQTANGVADKLFAKYDDTGAHVASNQPHHRAQNNNNDQRGGASIREAAKVDAVSSSALHHQGRKKYPREEMTSVPISSVASKYLPTSEPVVAPKKVSVPTNRVAATHNNNSNNNNNTTPVKAVVGGAVGTPQPRTSSPIQSASNTNNPRTSSPLPHRERKPSPTASLSSATPRSRSPVVSSPINKTTASRKQSNTNTAAAPEDSLSASPIGVEGRGGGGGSSHGGGADSRSLPSRSISSSNASHVNNINNNNDDNSSNHMMSSPAPTHRSSVSTTPSSSSRKPVLDRTRCTAINPSTNKPCRNPISDQNAGLCMQHKTLEATASKLESLQSVDEVDARIAIFKTEQRDRLQAMSSFVLNVLLAVQPSAQNGGRRGVLAEMEDVAWKQFMWQHNKDMDALRIARAAARGSAASGGGGASTVGSYGGGALALTRDSDDSSDDVGLFKNGSDDESDF